MLVRTKMIAEKIRSFSLVSTLLAAAILSASWTIIWLLVFFISTWVLDLKTAANAFILAYWLSVAAESIIRLMENSDKIAYFAKPHIENASGDNKDYTWIKSILIFSVGILTVFFAIFLSHRMTDIFTVDGIEFLGQVGRTSETFYAMLANWADGINNEGVAASLGVGFVLRCFIYKRSHKEKS